jgi:hypothetical protein
MSYEILLQREVERATPKSIYFAHQNDVFDEEYDDIEEPVKPISLIQRIVQFFKKNY